MPSAKNLVGSAAAKSIATEAAKGTVLGLGVALAYYFAVSAPIKADVANYYKKHPPTED
ncbi:hypothetical protein B484DRAFT_392256 [Ochromonadaceae sp. CCMP2298]|nr:hypothetical protein B484DRAFT_392256 [Ochromonadaceae sp. CCMP2298]